MDRKSSSSRYSTSPSSSDDEETKFPKRLPESERRRRQHSVEDLLGQIPEVTAEQESEEWPRTRRGSLPDDIRTEYIRRKSMPEGQVLGRSNLERFIKWAKGEFILNELDMIPQRKSHRLPSIQAHKEPIAEESEYNEHDVIKPKVQLLVDKADMPYIDRKSSHLSEMIEEEEKESETVTFKHEEFKIKADEYVEPKANLISMVSSDSILEEEEGKDEIQLKHDDFLKKITKNDQFYTPPSHDSLASPLQKVEEEDDEN